MGATTTQPGQTSTGPSTLLAEPGQALAVLPDRQQVFFIGSDGDVDQLQNIGAWVALDVITAVKFGGPVVTPAPGSAIAALPAEQQVFYFGADQHVHQLHCPANGWHYADLMTAVKFGGPAQAALHGSPIAALPAEQQVFYFGTDQHVHVLYCRADGWHHADLMTAVKFGGPAPAALPGSPIAALPAEQQVFYFGTDHDVHVLYCRADGWHHADLMEAVKFGGPVVAPAPGSAIAALAAEQQVFYFGTDQDVHVLYCRADGWHHADLMEAVKFGGPAQAPAPGSAIAALPDEQQVFYFGTDQHVHQLFCQADGWHHADLMTALRP